VKTFAPLSAAQLRPAINSLQSDDVGAGLIALDIKYKYVFASTAGAIHHEYEVPNNAEITNAGGYFDKLCKYRDPAIEKYFREEGLSLDSIRRSENPLLRSRSPQLDFILTGLIAKLEAELARPIRLFDHGCSVGEHYDMIDIMLRVDRGRGIGGSVLYTGLDLSPIALTLARMTHSSVPKSDFRLVQSEGSEIPPIVGRQDLALSVGVVNHVARPLAALEGIIDRTAYATTLALWVTSEPEGFWAVNHSGIPNYFLSIRDLERIARARPQGRFEVIDFVPETASSQGDSYIGVTPERTKLLGSYHLLWTTIDRLPFESQTLVF